MPSAAPYSRAARERSGPGARPGDTCLSPYPFSLLLVDPLDHLGDCLEDLLLVELDLLQGVEDLEMLGRRWSPARRRAVRTSARAITAGHLRAVILRDGLEYWNHRDGESSSLKNPVSRILTGHFVTSVSRIPFRHGTPCTGHLERTYPTPRGEFTPWTDDRPSSAGLADAGLRGPDLRMSGVPLQGPPKALLEIHGGLPPDPLADLGRVEVLAVDLAARVAASAVVGLHITGAELADQLDHLAHRVWPAPARIERLAAGLPRGEAAC